MTVDQLIPIIAIPVVTGMATAIVALWRSYVKLQEKRHVEYKELVTSLTGVLDRNTSALLHHSEAFERLTQQCNERCAILNAITSRNSR